MQDMYCIGGEATEIAHLEAQQRARLAFEQLGPTFVKLGQMLSTGEDLLPPAWTTELARLHSDVAPVPFDDLLPQVELALGRSPFEGLAMLSAFRVARFNCEIELALERAAQLADDLDWPVATDFGYLAFDQMRNAIEDSDISVNLCLDSGTPNLQDHWRAAGEFGPVYLRD